MKTFLVWWMLSQSLTPAYPQANPALEPRPRSNVVTEFTDQPVSAPWLILGFGMGAIVGIIVGAILIYKLDDAGGRRTR